jgi:hypothetical protein
MEQIKAKPLIVRQLISGQVYQLSVQKIFFAMYYRFLKPGHSSSYRCIIVLSEIKVMLLSYCLSALVLEI